MLRTLTSERMDDPDLDPGLHRQALLGLRRLNSLSWGSRSMTRFLRQASEKQARPLRILDIATGSGDGLLGLLQASRKWRYPLVGAGCDLSEVALAEARFQASQRGIDAEFFRCDALSDTLPTTFDYLTCSLFCHHLSVTDISKLLNNMANAARVGLVVNDLVRSHWNLINVWLACRLVTRSPVVHFDGPVSVRAALTRAELTQIVEKLGWQKYQVRSQFPARMLLTWERS
ncbi:MAG: methyltransferase domain-containing protein [Fimbriiglobus sp.]